MSAPARLTITYIGNEGVLIDDGSVRVLIDGLFSRKAAPYADTSADTYTRLARVEPPFDRIDVILATHFHNDHFDAEAVGSYLSRTKAEFVSTPQSRELMEELVPDFSRLAVRTHAVLPDQGRRESVSIGRIRVHAFSCSHGRVNYGDVEHLGLVVYVGGRSIVHLGDAIIDRRTLTAAGILRERIDLAFLPFWYFTHPIGRRLMGAEFRPAQAFAVHLPLDGADRIATEVQRTFPDVVVLRESLTTHAYPSS